MLATLRQSLAYQLVSLVLTVVAWSLLLGGAANGYLSLTGWVGAQIGRALRAHPAGEMPPDPPNLYSELYYDPR